MKRLSLSVCVVLFAAAAAEAGPITLTLAPAGGVISGQAGATAGWDFTLANNTSNWISVTSSALTFETNPLLGVYTDFIGLQGGPLPSFAVAPFSSWMQPFDLANQMGLGSYAIDPGAPPSAENDGTVLVSFDIFNGDPTGTGFQTGSSNATSGFSASVVQPPSSDTPEPSTFALGVWEMLALALWRRATKTVQQNQSAQSETSSGLTSMKGAGIK